jgi:hypothetical protein
MRWLFHWHDRDVNSLEQRIERLADLYIEVGVEVAEIKALLHSAERVKMSPDRQALSTIEEQIIMLARSQEALARQLADLKAMLESQPDEIQSGEVHPGRIESGK